ncbi:hypothetical protein HanRHA438_Chr05g0239241 [Helianthus annuus]|nr:hypothetical protein HanRHA438_Chr05g0239241 [Helianthus annuus]
MNHPKTIENSKIGELCTHIVTTKHVKRGDYVLTSKCKVSSIQRIQQAQTKQRNSNST